MFRFEIKIIFNLYGLMNYNEIACFVVVWFINLSSCFVGWFGQLINGIYLFIWIIDLIDWLIDWLFSCYHPEILLYLVSSVSLVDPIGVQVLFFALADISAGTHIAGLSSVYFHLNYQIIVFIFLLFVLERFMLKTRIKIRLRQLSDFFIGKVHVSN